MKTSAVREFRRRNQRIPLVSVRGAAVVTLFLYLVVGAALSAVDGSYVKAAVFGVAFCAVVSVFRVTTKDDSYDRYLAAVEVLKEMSGLIMDLESENIPVEGKHGEDFYTHYNLAQARASKPGRLTRDDMDFVAINTALAHTALEDHAAVQSVEGD